MDPMLIFTISGALVLVALMYSLLEWARILQKSTGQKRTGSILFAISFLLYAVGQFWVIFQVLNAVPRSTIPSYMYALAAFLFAIGSYYHRRSTEE